jgi:hypothetical protein
MKITGDLPRLSKELRDLPRHLWDEHLLGFCEAVLMDHSGLERARIPVDTQRPASESPRPRRQHF